MPQKNRRFSITLERWIKSPAIILALLFLFFFTRYLLIPFTNYDTDGYVRWYNYITQKGILEALGKNFAIYTPPYLYLLALTTLTKDFIPQLTAIKLIPNIFDLINAIFIFKILRLNYKNWETPAILSTLFLFTPTIILNSAYWGQIDSLYTCFLLICVYFLLTDRINPALIAFGIGISIKAQAAFLGPLILIFSIKKQIPWYKFTILPVTYYLMMLPSILAGRSILDVSTVYLNQAAELQILSFNSPNWYLFFPQSAYATVMPIGMIIASMAIMVWIWVNTKGGYSITNENLLLLALIATAIAPFLLPKMHDRYFYPADVFSLLLAFYAPGYWFLAVAYQIISGLAYSVFLFNADKEIVLVLATEINTLLIGYLIWKNRKLCIQNQERN